MNKISLTFQSFARSLALSMLSALSLFVLIPAVASVQAQTLTASSMNWAGYVATSGNYTSVSGTWTIPTVANSSQLTADATWVGIGGVSSNDLIQAGTQAITGQGSTTQYEAWVETLPNSSQPVALTVNAGDSISVSISEVSTNEWLTTIKDNTTGQNYSGTVSYTSSMSSAEWIEEAPMSGSSLLPLDGFGSVQFSNAFATQNGTTVNLSTSQASAMTMLNSYGQTLAYPSAIGSDSESFTVTKSPSATNIPGQTTRTFRTGGRHGVQGLSGFSRHANGNGGWTVTVTTPDPSTPTVTTTTPTSTSSNGTGDDSGYGWNTSFPFPWSGFGNSDSGFNSAQQMLQQLENEYYGNGTTNTGASSDDWQQVYSIQLPSFGNYSVYFR